MNDPAVNQFHQALRVLTLEDPTCERAIALGNEAIRLRGYKAVKDDPGMYAWVMENEAVLRERIRRMAVPTGIVR